MSELGACALQGVALYFQALAEPTRLRIIEALKEGPMRTKDLAALFGTSSANVSRHLAVLERQGIVARRPASGSTYYGLPDETAGELIKMGEELRRLALRKAGNSR
ncbi:MAG TPA: metalloregulator ArsR/SmtB family transcription factor [Burkholderiaceae bacterium]